MCELLTVMDSNIVQVALNGLENILKSGNQNFQKPNPYAVIVEECYGEFLFISSVDFDKINIICENAQLHGVLIEFYCSALYFKLNFSFA